MRIERTRPAGEDEPATAVRLCWDCLSAPGIGILALGFVLPMGLLAAYSVLRDGKRGRLILDVNLDNYVTFLTDWFYLGILLETLALALAVALICAVLGYPVAYFLARTASRWRGVLIFLVLAPLLISVVIRNLGWVPILSRSGAVNVLLLELGLIGDPLVLINNFTGVVIGLVHALLPFMILMLMTVIQRINRDVEEAAVNLGASRWDVFRRVLFPLTRKGLAAGFLLVFTIAVSSYTTPAVMGGNRVFVMSTFIEQQVRFVLKYAFGAAMTVVLLVVVVALTLVATQRLERNG